MRFAISLTSIHRARSVSALLLGGALLASCGGGAGSASSPVVPIRVSPSPTPGTPATPSSVPVSFSIAIPTQSTASAHSQYVSAATQSAQISVAPAAGGTTQTSTVNCTTVCSGTVNAPVGSDTFTVNLYSAQNGGGSVLSTGSATQTITSGQANTVNLTFNPVVASIALSIASGAAAGTPGSYAVNLTAKDASGNTIVGPGSFVNASGANVPVQLSTNDTTGAVGLASSSVSAPGSVNINYTGRAIAPVTVTASAPGLTSATAQFAPALSPIVVAYASDTLNPNFSGIDLTSASQAVGFTASEAGYTGSFGQTFTITPASGCTNIGAIAQTGTTSTMTATAATNPSPGSCTVTIADTLGQSATVPMYYSGFAYNASPQSFVVPSNVSHITVTAAGGCGGGGLYAMTQANGGPGTVVVATLQATSGASFQVQTGGCGGGAYFSGGLATAGSPGSNGGGAGASWGGGGGGYTALVSSGPVYAIIAGGGGGGGASYNGVSNGGIGLNATTGSATLLLVAGGDGAGAGNASGGLGGSSIGGAGGVSTVGCGNGTAGSSLRGGDGALTVTCGGGGGGGGGGGYFGGGGGAGASSFSGTEASGSGGAGSSYINASATNVTVTGGANNGPGYLLISF